ncbi:DMT family transporter [Halorussus halophilus]|uniref:DMT family transporter n=1 Tax=Halorussus halophilus TaxID=2650975 RepID=UPI001300E00A|nr:DMT family transporter [Halorussus halophilus]
MTRYRALASFLLLSALWGTSFVAVEAGLPYVPPVLFAALRYDLAGLLLLAYVGISVGRSGRFGDAERWRPRGWVEWLPVAVGAATFIAAHHAFMFVGQQYTTSAVAAIIISLDPILTTVFARALLPSERLGRVGTFGLLVGLAGVAIVASPDPDRLLAPGVVGKGLILLAAASFALGAVLLRRTESSDLPPVPQQAWMMLLGAGLLHLTSAALPDESLSAVEWTPTAILALAYLAPVAGCLGFLLYFRLLDSLGPVEINLVGYVAPIFAAFGGWLLLSETIDLATVVGFVVIVAGFTLVKRDALAEEWRRIRVTVSGD